MKLWKRLESSSRGKSWRKTTTSISRYRLVIATMLPVVKLGRRYTSTVKRGSQGHRRATKAICWAYLSEISHQQREFQWRRPVSTQTSFRSDRKVQMILWIITNQTWSLKWVWEPSWHLIIRSKPAVMVWECRCPLQACRISSAVTLVITRWIARLRRTRLPRFTISTSRDPLRLTQGHRWLRWARRPRTLSLIEFNRISKLMKQLMSQQQQTAMHWIKIG